MCTSHYMFTLGIIEPTGRLPEADQSEESRIRRIGDPYPPNSSRWWPSFSPLKDSYSKTLELETSPGGRRWHRAGKGSIWLGCAPALAPSCGPPRWETTPASSSASSSSEQQSTSGRRRPRGWVLRRWRFWGWLVMELLWGPLVPGPAPDAASSWPGTSVWCVWRHVEMRRGRTGWGSGFHSAFHACLLPPPSLRPSLPRTLPRFERLRRCCLGHSSAERNTLSCCNLYFYMKHETHRSELHLLWATCLF